MVKIIPSKISKPQSIRVLIVEDSEGDVLLIIRELKKGGYDPEYERVQTFPAMEKALKEEQWDIILCDYIMPEFNAPSAIALLKETNIDIPLIIVSGAIGEETAVECMRKGAHDYIMKTNLSRLCPAISRELVEADSRRIRKNVEVALRVSEERFRLVQDNSPDGFTILRPVRDAMWRVVDFTWIYENATIARLNGTEPNAVVGRSLLELFPEHRGSQSLKAYQQVAESGKNCIFESDFWSEGNTKPIWFRIVVVPTGENIAILAQDITERKLAEEALRESEELFSLFMRHSPVYTFIKEVTPTESRVLQASDNYEQMIGIPGPQMIGRTMAELFPPGFAAKITADDWTVVSRGNVIQQDEDLNGRNYASIKFPIIQRGKTLLAGYTIDITERKQAEEALINSEKKYRNLFENASEGIFQSTPEGRYISINPAFTKIGGYNSPDEMMASVTDIQKKMYV
ncbi:MAG: PAS domain S-box protein, partial [Syntrophus sp. (in: bacteria)]